MPVNICPPWSSTLSHTLATTVQAGKGRLISRQEVAKELWENPAFPVPGSLLLAKLGIMVIGVPVWAV